MSLQEAAEAAARTGVGESSTAAPAAVAPEPAAPEPTTETAAVLPDTMTQPLRNANDPDVPMVTGDSDVAPTLAAEDVPVGGDEEMDEDEELRRAMALSRGEDPEEDVVMAEEGEGDDDEEDEEAAIAMSSTEAKGEDIQEKK